MSAMASTTDAPLTRPFRLSPTLSGYVARNFGFWLFAYWLGLLGVILLISTVDLLDKLATKEVSLTVVIQMVLLKLPFLSEKTIPFTVLFAGLTCFWRLTRSHELVVTRAAGISIWQVLLPTLGVAVLAGAVTVTVLNPVAAVLLGRFEQFEARYIHGQTSALAVSRSGLWLRQADPGGQSVIHAQRVTHSSMVLHNVIIFRFEDEDRFVGRIDAARAELHPGYWLLLEAWQARPGDQSHFSEEIRLATDLTRDKILESFAAPESVSFWSLPGFIELLESAGFSALRHRLQLHRLLAIPFLLAAMTLLAATFSLRPQRRGRVALVVFGGAMTGFLLFFLTDFVHALGLSGNIPVVLAAWSPAGVSSMLGVAMLLHLEDG